MNTVNESRVITGQTDLYDFLDSVEYRVARSKEELESAYGLVYKEYLKRGYAKKNDSGLKLSIYNALPQTTTFVSILKKEVFSTATLIPDSPLGLPMDEIYLEELNVLRRQNKRLCEISMLASDTEIFGSGISLMLNSKKMFFIFYLFKIIFDYARDILKADCICITVNPKHSLTYEFLLFKDLGGLKTYNNANAAPAIAKYLDLNSVEEDCRIGNKEGLYKMFIKDTTSPDRFHGKLFFTEKDLNYFFMDRTDIFKNATAFQLEYIKNCYFN